MSRLASLLVLALATGASAAPAPTPASPGEHTHVVAAGETLASLASQYYGAAWKAVYLSTRNGLSGEKDLAAGLKLVVPATYMYRVHKGDSAAELARKQLGDRDRARAILSENGLRAGAELPVGVELLMPFHLKVVTEAGDTWARLAARYYASAERAGFLKDYNPGVTLAAGSRLTVPIFDKAALDVQNRKLVKPAPPPAKPPTPTKTVAAPSPPPVPVKTATAPAGGKPATPPYTVGPAGLPAPVPGTLIAAAPAAPGGAIIAAPPSGPILPVTAPSSPPGASPGVSSISAAVAAAAANPVDAGSGGGATDVPRVVTPALRATLARAVEEYRQGEFESGCTRLESVLAQGPLPLPERGTVLSHLGFCAVAAGDRPAATDYFRKWLEADPKAELDPVTTSPKIRAIFQEVAESVRAEGAESH